jgi:hypothetical protein
MAAAPGPGPGDTGTSGACGKTSELLGLGCGIWMGTAGGGTCAAAFVATANKMVSVVASMHCHTIV